MKKVHNRLIAFVVSLSKHWGLGEHISVETVYDEFTPEYIFTIPVPVEMSKEEENKIFMKMNFQMECFCKDNNMFNFLLIDALKRK